ncbi:hypothetical protein TIFTF001_021969 [Ficus carica]|uniref:Uncharacterized protein n=1 Tax=Ficus carica TaxID=3494 RepID=A0AA88ADQ4_FICCA|nr:hypothetical protein TIFTF001_021969 [Ficus carica]
MNKHPPWLHFIFKNVASSSDLLDAAEAATQLLKAESRIWEQNSRKLMINMEALQKELSDKEKHRASLEEELSALRTECKAMKQEVKQLKISLQETREKQTANEDLVLNSIKKTLKEFEDEINLQKEANVNLSSQLKKSLPFFKNLKAPLKTK